MILSIPLLPSSFFLKITREAIVYKQGTSISHFLTNPPVLDSRKNSRRIIVFSLGNNNNKGGGGEEERRNYRGGAFAGSVLYKYSCRGQGKEGKGKTTWPMCFDSTSVLEAVNGVKRYTVPHTVPDILSCKKEEEAKRGSKR